MKIFNAILAFIIEQNKQAKIIDHIYRVLFVHYFYWTKFLIFNLECWIICYTNFIYKWIMMKENRFIYISYWCRVSIDLIKREWLFIFKEKTFYSWGKAWPVSSAKVFMTRSLFVERIVIIWLERNSFKKICN